MEQTKESLRNDYNNAVDYFNEKKYDRFLRNIRTVICLLSKYVIFDIANDENEARDIIGGFISLQWNKNANCYDLQNYPANHEPSGREFPILMYRFFICKHKDYCTNYADRSKKEIKAVMNGYGEGLAGLYSITSEWNHSEKSCNLSANNHAICTASYIESFIDYLRNKRILSESTIATLLSFTKFDFSNTKEIESHEGRIEELNGKIRDLEETLNERNVIIVEKNNRIKDLESQNQSSTESEERVKSLTQDLEKSKSKYADDLASYQMHLANKETEISDLKKELEKYKQACVESNQKAEEERNIRLELETTIAQMQADQNSKDAAEEVSLDNLFDIAEEAEESNNESNQSIFDLFGEENEEEESNDDTIEHVSSDDNSIFEQFIIDRFAINRHRCFTRIDSDSSSMEPEIVIQLSAYSQIKTFAVAIDYKSKWEDYLLNWDYLKAYRTYNKKIDGAFYYVLGVGGKPNSPRSVYIIPLSLFKKNRSFTKEDLKDYCYRNPKGNLRYDISEDDLTFVD